VVSLANPLRQDLITVSFGIFCKMSHLSNETAKCASYQ
jgi:hypothetical protein